MRAFILGASGMLGQAVSSTFESSGIETYKISRSATISWDAASDNLSALLHSLEISEKDILVNCIGWIPQKSRGSVAEDESLASLLNVELLRKIAEAQTMHGFRWLQIGTDCVFRGNLGPHNEASLKDASDLYGRSKVAGESYAEGAFLLRASIVGPDAASSSGLFEWFRVQPVGAQVSGYINHIWNGVSTKVFAEVALGIANNYFGEPFAQHLIPLGSASKHELLMLFAQRLGRQDVLVTPREHATTLDRRLATIYPNRNDELWRMAGYSRPQTIEEMVHSIQLGE
ncbi:MAG: hypothetical protein RIS08_1027 [Actinomycetota bacterium]|jgi:dTDP-4-dehydrorhamnose reductase